MDHRNVKSSTAALRIAVAVGVGVVAHTLNPSTGNVAQAYAQVSGGDNQGSAGECASGFCGTPVNNGGGSGSGSGSGILVDIGYWLGLFF
jgi:hypothetical protein